MDTEKRRGIIGYIKSRYWAFRGNFSKIKDTKNDVTQYDNIGTPVWAGKMSEHIHSESC